MQSNEISFSFDEDSNDDSYHTYYFDNEMKTKLFFEQTVKVA